MSDDDEDRDQFFTERHALEAAVAAARNSPCQKSQRGAVVFVRGYGVVSSGWNHQPAPFACDGTIACKAACAQLCVHAEAHALQQIGRNDDVAWRVVAGAAQLTRVPRDAPLEVLHVKIVDGEAVPSGDPSCWQCSKAIADDDRISVMWLLRPEGLRQYDRAYFHALTLGVCGLHPRVR